MKGYSNRWYVTDLHLGQGIAPNPAAPGTGAPTTSAASSPTPSTCRPDTPARRPTPLTWVAALAVGELQPVRRAGPAAAPAAVRAARLDLRQRHRGLRPGRVVLRRGRERLLVQVWRQLALGLPLDTERTDTHRLLDGRLRDVRARARPPRPVRRGDAAGRPPCVRRCTSSAPSGAAATVVAAATCTARTTTRPGPWSPTPRGCPTSSPDGVLDELVPYSSVLEQVPNEFDKAGLRYHFLTYPTEDHLAFAAQDRFDGRSRCSASRPGSRTRAPSTTAGTPTRYLLPPGHRRLVGVTWLSGLGCPHDHRAAPSPR